MAKGSKYFFSGPYLTWIINEPSLLQMRGGGPCRCTSVPQMDRNEADAVRSARPKGKKCR